MTLEEKRDAILDAMRLQCRRMMLSVTLRDVSGNVTQMAVGPDDIHPKLEKFLRDCANNAAQALAEDHEHDELAARRAQVDAASRPSLVPVSGVDNDRVISRVVDHRNRVFDATIVGPGPMDKPVLLCNCGRVFHVTDDESVICTVTGGTRSTTQAMVIGYEP